MTCKGAFEGGAVFTLGAAKTRLRALPETHSIPLTVCRGVLPLRRV